MSELNLNTIEDRIENEVKCGHHGGCLCKYNVTHIITPIIAEIRRLKAMYENELPERHIKAIGGQLTSFSVPGQTLMESNDKILDICQKLRDENNKLKAEVASLKGNCK